MNDILKSFTILGVTMIICSFLAFVITYPIYLSHETYMKYATEGFVEREVIRLYTSGDITFSHSNYEWVKNDAPINGKVENDKR